MPARVAATLQCAPSGRCNRTATAAGLLTPGCASRSRRPDDVPTVCCDDGRYTVLTLTGFVAGVLVDRETIVVDNGQSRSAFTLTAERPIEEIVVHVWLRGRSPPRREGDAPRPGQQPSAS